MAKVIPFPSPLRPLPHTMTPLDYLEYRPELDAMGDENFAAMLEAEARGRELVEGRVRCRAAADAWGYR